MSIKPAWWAQKGRGSGRREKKRAPPNSPSPFDACFAVWSPYRVETRYEEELRAQVSFYRSALSYIYFYTITGAKEIVPYTEDLVI